MEVDVIKNECECGCRWWKALAVKDSREDSTFHLKKTEQIKK